VNGCAQASLRQGIIATPVHQPQIQEKVNIKKGMVLYTAAQSAVQKETAASSQFRQDAFETA
jgi:hypothetical protein